MNISEFLIILSLALIALGLYAYIHFAIISNLFPLPKDTITSDRASAFAEFISGITAPIFALAGFLIVYATIMDQNNRENLNHFENHFYKLLDFNRSNYLEISISAPKTCKEIKGGAVWVSYYSQIRKAYEIIETDSFINQMDAFRKVDLAFATFFYGISRLDSARLYEYFNKAQIPPSQVEQYVISLKAEEHCSTHSSYFTGHSNKVGFYLKQ